MPPFKAQLKLVGQCNRCGLCCTASWHGKQLRCHNLEVTGPIGVGAPGASTCRAYRQRFPGMPIMMYDDTGSIQALGACSHGSDVDSENIAQWIGKGCSLKLEGDRNV